MEVKNQNEFKMFYPERCDDDDGNDQHDSGEDEGDGEETGHDSQSVDLSLQQVVQLGACLSPAGRQAARTHVEFPHHSQC